VAAGGVTFLAVSPWAAGSGLANEYVPPQSYRDFNTNWGTFVFSAPAG
jgi:hypothetical protein